MHEKCSQFVGAQMIEYEMRILNRAGEAVIKESEVHYSDIRTINWARKFAKGMRYGAGQLKSFQRRCIRI